ncbi:DUF447 domain-containing protein [Halosegnis marinus]|uniref:DUF447 domain-containing protein n=1 Tax=Halosegnis marinus TaxID=3034023 RepID=A0ABD5ZKH6_9EURY|nr:DUF447 domain-containing protein [Halosegnis sp. DT85]
MTGEWPAAWDGVAESVVTTLGPNERWNVAALGLHAPEGGVSVDGAPDDPVTARTWGRTRTWRNFAERGGGYVQFTRDPVDFVEAACSTREEADPVLDSAAAWAEVEATERASGTEGDTEWTDWTLQPLESAVVSESVPVVSRGHAAVVEATVAASRLGVPGYDDGALRERIRFFASVVESAGGARERAAFERFEALVSWRRDG